MDWQKTVSMETHTQRIKEYFQMPNDNGVVFIYNLIFTLREDIFAGRKFSEFRGICPKFRNLIYFLTPRDCWIAKINSRNFFQNWWMKISVSVWYSVFWNTSYQDHWLFLSSKKVLISQNHKIGPLYLKATAKFNSCKIFVEVAIAKIYSHEILVKAQIP